VRVGAPGGGDAVGAGGQAGERVARDGRAVGALGVAVVAAEVDRLVARTPGADRGEARVAVVEDHGAAAGRGDDGVQVRDPLDAHAVGVDVAVGVVGQLHGQRVA